MFDILLFNPILWLNFLIPFGIGVYLIFTNQEYALKEFAAQIGLTLFLLISFFSLGFYSSDLYSKTYINGSASEIVHEEEWTELVHYTEEECSGSGDKRICHTVHKTRHDYHPDSYYILSTIGTFYINEEQFLNAVKDFGKTITDYDHIGQISSGDGRTFKSYPNTIVPVTDSEQGINYIYAAKHNIIKSPQLKELEKVYAKELIAYPEIMSDKYGNGVINRVFNAHLSSYWQNINDYLNISAAKYGASKEINPMIYLTTSKDREFAYVVQGFYKDAHKNDAILVCGVDQNGTVAWSEGLALTKSEDFIVDSKKFKGYNLRDLNSSLQLAKDFESLYLKSYKRTSMDEYRHLASEIDLPLWGYFIIIITNIIGSFFLFQWFLRNRL